MTGISAANKWDVVLSQLWRQSRFAAYFYQSVDLLDSRSIPTLALTLSDRRFILFYNGQFVLDTPPDHLIGLLAHEMLHIVLNHEHRVRPGQDIYLCNLAQDMVINSYLKAHERTFFSRKKEGARASLVLPDGLPVIPSSFGKKSHRESIYDVTWESVYAWLKTRYADEKPGIRDNPGTEEPLPGIEQWRGSGWDRYKAFPQEGLQFVDGSGRLLPAGIHLFETMDAGQRIRAGAERILGFIQKHDECREERLYTDISRLIRQPEPAQSRKWTNVIRTIADQSSQASRWDYSFARPNRRFFDAGIYAPGRYLKRKPLITIVVDVSGSMAANPGEIEAALGAVEELTEDYRINLLCIDQDLFVPRKQNARALPAGGQAYYLYRKGDWRYIKTGSGGATFFSPLFNDYMKSHTEALVVITDGEIYDLAALQPYSPTLWVVSGNRARSFAPSFGQVTAL